VCVTFQSFAAFTAERDHFRINLVDRDGDGIINPPGCPPGRVNFFRLISLIKAMTSFQPLT